MTIRTRRASNPTLTASELEMIMTALDAYQHHTAFRDLRDKLAIAADMATGALSTAASTGGGRNRTQTCFTA